MKAVIKDSVLVLSLISSVVGLALIYVASAGSQTKYISIGDITPDMVGRTVSTGGHISDVDYNPKGHVFLTIDDNGNGMQVALFYDYVKALNGAGLTSKDFVKGRLINVSGTLDIYNNALQIIPRKVGDLKVG